MRHRLLFILFTLSLFTIAQGNDEIKNNIIYENIYSEKLNSYREIQIRLPKTYDHNKDNYYPVFFVFDGHYLFDLVSGNVDYMSFWKSIPESIVVGINQTDSRYNDINVLDNINYTPISSTANFFDFISLELIPYMNKKYRTTKFRVAVGNESTANFINFFLIRKFPIMNGYINISPKYSENMKERIATYLINSSDEIFYYVSTSNRDFKTIADNVLDFNKKMDSLKNKNVKYKFNSLNNRLHFNLAAYSIPEAIENIYSIYDDIDKVEYDSIILKLESSPVKYLEDKYEKIQRIYGLKKEISINDFLKIEEYIEETEKFSFFKNLAKLATINYRETILPSYFMGRFYEHTGNHRKAIQTYRSAYNLDDFIEISKEYLFQRANSIADDFGYEKQEYNWN